jgi:hypothetical protein
MNAIIVIVACCAFGHASKVPPVDKIRADGSNLVLDNEPLQALRTLLLAPTSYMLPAQSASVLRAADAWMGRGDVKTAKGKRYAKSFGKYFGGNRRKAQYFRRNLTADEYLTHLDPERHLPEVPKGRSPPVQGQGGASSKNYPPIAKKYFSNVGDGVLAPLITNPEFVMMPEDIIEAVTEGAPEDLPDISEIEEDWSPNWQEFTEQEIDDYLEISEASYGVIDELTEWRENNNWLTFDTLPGYGIFFDAETGEEIQGNKQDRENEFNLEMEMQLQNGLAVTGQFPAEVEFESEDDEEGGDDEDLDLDLFGPDEDFDDVVAPRPYSVGEGEEEEDYEAYAFDPDKDKTMMEMIIAAMNVSKDEEVAKTLKSDSFAAWKDEEGNDPYAKTNYQDPNGKAFDQSMWF